MMMKNWKPLLTAFIALLSKKNLKVKCGMGNNILILMKAL